MTQEQMQQYADWLVNFINKGTINIKTGQPFTVDDIKNADVKAIVQTKLTAQ